MIANIRDHRRRPYRWLKVNAVVEATTHDNRIADGDQAAPAPGDVDYEELLGVPVSQAVAWAQAFPGAVTLYIYDEGDGRYAWKSIPQVEGCRDVAKISQGGP